MLMTPPSASRTPPQLRWGGMSQSLGCDTIVSASQHLRCESIRCARRGEVGGRRQIDEGLWPAVDHALDFGGELGGIGRIGDQAETMVARQAPDQAEGLGKDGPSGARRPQ